jgi:S1-C subfamily serine protease
LLKFLISFFAILFLSVAAISAPIPKEKKPDPIGKSKLKLYFTASVCNDKDGVLRVEYLTLIATGSDVANKHKLADGDILRKIGNDEVKEGLDFTEKIGQYRPGAVVELTFQRNNEMIKVKVRIEEAIEKEDDGLVPESPLPEIPDC